ncbi:Dna /pantothenate metabolism flavoprotein [Cardiosporidium cionae]|uniref:Dna /pantothenate metabolism flavoprotein n=1 Tax=Cardiosporidium cionae TaxID=476202 RepID=A0ABQ7J832_9APIC|nr:Dna /pantothenate metabolism flavoprotein [Cardiosporidium cionae]|eukprot:KAF8820161.1 Dna /pantothenate metabolism flavoprotein [Cardiosporidium cionae]
MIVLYPPTQRDLNLLKYKKNLLNLSFTTLAEFLFGMRMLCEECQLLKRRSLFVQCAAVSDFYIPFNSMSENKLPSGGDLTLQLKQVPKLLYIIKQLCPLTVVISFKLETDEELIKKKASIVLASGQVDMVIGNLLESCHDRVVCFTLDSTVIIEKNAQKDIELELTQMLIEMHRKKSMEEIAL